MPKSKPPLPPSGISRRDWLRTAALSTAYLGSKYIADPRLAAAVESRNDLVDAHSHIWTPDIERFPLVEGRTKKDLQPASFTTEQLLAAARPLGIGRVVLIQHHVFYGYDNSYMLDAARRFPNVFRVVGMVDDLQPNPDKKMRELLPRKVTGFRITSLIRRGKWLQGDGMKAIWRCAAETRQAMCCLINPEDLADVDRMCRKHPETPVVIDHFARVGMDGTIRDRALSALCRLARHKSTVMKVSAFYALGKKRPPYLDLAPMIRRVFEAYGSERMMWASDCPYQLDGDNTYEASLALVKERLDFLTDDQRLDLLRNTANRVYYFD